jgi:hypothetical protein
VAIGRVESALTLDRPASVVVNTAVDVLAVTHPAIGVLVAAYKISKVAYPVVKAAKEEYDRTGDANAAAVAGARQVVSGLKAESRDEAISNAVDVGWATLKTSTGLQTNELQDRILTSAFKNTLDKVLPQ